MQELISRGAQMEAHIDDVCLGTKTQEDHLILLGEFFAVCQENHTRLKLEKCEFMQETMQYLGFDVGYGWWTPAASKAKPLMDAKVRHEDPKKGLHDVRSFIGACNFFFFFFVIQVQSHSCSVLRRPAQYTLSHPHPQVKGQQVGRLGSRRRRDDAR